MIYWVIMIILLNLYVLLLTDAPDFVKLNAGMVAFIALVALVRIIQMRRKKMIEKLANEVNQLMHENVELRQKLGETETNK